MKFRTLLTITATMITAAAILLTGSLALLHGSAFTEATFDEAPAIEVSDVIVDTPVIDATDDEVIEDDATDDEVAVPDEPVEDVEPEIEAPKYDYPDFEYSIIDAKELHYCGCNQDNPYGAHFDLHRGVTVDVYSHKTGELVGQLTLQSAEIENYISELVAEEFNPWAQTFEPDTDDEVVNLPEGDYRIEVYSGTWFSYTYGNNSMFELTQCTLTFYGGEKMTGYIDYLIADYIAEIEAGNVQKPNPENAVSKLEYAGLEGYWEGHWVEVPYGQSYYYEGAGRWTERFPYVEEN